MMKKDQIIDNIKANQILIICLFLALVFIGTVSVCAASWNSRLSLAFTAIASVSTVATLIIAIRLYDRFGLKNEFVVKQAEKIFELFDILLEQTIVAKGAGTEIMIRANLEQLRLFHHADHFLVDAPKKLFVSMDNYDEFYQKISPIRQSYWLPREIQEAMDFLMIWGIGKDDYDPLNHVKMTFTGAVKPSEYRLLAIPDQTLGAYVLNMINLVEQIDKWLKKHSQIEINLVPRY